MPERLLYVDSKELAGLLGAPESVKITSADWDIRSNTLTLRLTSEEFDKSEDDGVPYSEARVLKKNIFGIPIWPSQ